MTIDFFHIINTLFPPKYLHPQLDIIFSSSPQEPEPKRQQTSVQESSDSDN